MSKSDTRGDWLKDASAMAAVAVTRLDTKEANRDALQSIAYSLIGLLEIAEAREAREHAIEAIARGEPPF